MFVLVIWIICGVACGNMAEKRNRNVLVWVISGFLFGIFAVVALAMAGTVHVSSPVYDESGRRIQ